MAALEQASGEIYFNPWDEAYRANPYPHYQPLYGRPPHLLKFFFPMALVGRYRDAARILRDHEHFSSVPPMSPFLQERLEAFGNAPRVVFSDPPVHTRLRRLVSRAFTPSRIRSLEPRIRDFTRTLLDGVAEKGALEVMSDLANPLPVMVIAEMLGVPPEDYQIFKQWSDLVIESDNTPPGMPLPAPVLDAFKSLREYFVAEIEKRRRNGGQDLVSVLVAAREEAEALSEEELIAFVMLLLLAGNETTTNLIGNGMLALGRHPEQLVKLLHQPALMPRAIEEMLRYDCPVQATVRYPKLDLDIDGVTLGANTVTFVMVAAANRDPAQFSQPEVFDISRDPNPHLAFGEGIHYCLGAPLARMEGAIAISAALERFPGLRLANSQQPLTYKGSYSSTGIVRITDGARVAKPPMDFRLSGETAAPAPAAADPAGPGLTHRARLPFIARRFPPFTPRQWRVFGISTTAGFFDNYDSALLSLALKQIQHGLGIAEARLGATLSLIRLGYIASLIISPLADVFGRRRLLLYTIVGYTIFTGLSAVAPRANSFVAAQFAARAFSGAEATISLVILAEEVDAAVRGWALGMLGALSISGYGLAAIVFALIGIVPFGWRGLYALALVPLALIIPLRRMLPESRRFEKEHRAGAPRVAMLQPLRALFSDYPGRLTAMLAVVFLGSLAGGSAGFFVPKYLQESHHWSPAQVSSLYVFGGALGIIGNIVAGRLSDRFGRRITGPLFIAIEGLFAYKLYSTATAAVIGLWVGWLFCDQAGVTVTNAYSAELFPTSFRSAAASALYVARYGGGAVGLFIEGMLYGVLRSHWHAIRMLTGFWLLSAIMMYLLFPETARRELEEIAPEPLS